ncbi:hypothetical protein CDL12_11557 [Handroanthus impetiginosus]|uniref:Uncharacterized protein n=1 Tax=Handroanthus impetiginosus TaxID=429701 RepID=A0A2G9HE52_9LAMI|nr:hypothetical protein CDL12_11557 [Handroanthus impetiginosus]
MGFGALRSIIRPVSRILVPASHCSPAARTFSATSTTALRHLFAPHRRNVPWIFPCSAFHSLTDTKYPKRRPSDRPRRKRANLRPPGPYAWVKCVPGEPILPNQPNEGSVKRRNEKKRIKQHRAFIMSEKRKRKVQLQEAKRKKMMKRVERKMAAVARERAWAERLVELKRIEEEKKKAATA